MGNTGRVMMTAIGVLTVGAATMFVIKTGGPATAGDSGPRTVVATAGPATPHAPAEAVTVTVDPAAASETAVRLPGTAGSALPPLDLRQIVYTVAGNQRPEDPVTVVYADETGTLRTLHDVTLPWTMTVTPELPVNYVTANGRGSQLNCWITDAAGGTVVSSTDFSPSTTCNR